MATYNYFDSDKWIIITQICIVFGLNALVFVPIFIYEVDVGIWIYFLGFVLDAIFVFSLFNAKKNLVVGSDCLTIVRRWEQKKYPFNQIKNIRFYYNSEEDFEGGYIRGMNICEITINPKIKINIMADEFENFDGFKFDLIEAHQNYLDNPPVIPGKAGPNP